MGFLQFQASGGGPSGGSSQLIFTTNGSGAYTNAVLVGKSVVISQYSVDGAGTFLGTDFYTFNSGTGAITGLEANTQYLAFYE